MRDREQVTGPRQDFSFSASSGNVRAVLRRVVSALGESLTEDAAGMVELALAEALNNIVEHAYADLPPGPIRLSLTRQPGSVVCLIKDEGRPMPNLEAPDGALQKVANRVEDLPEGGWGWSLIRALTTDLHYRRQANQNQLTFQIPVAASC